MKTLVLLCACAALTLSGCSGWPFSPAHYGEATPVPSRTPSIQTATPLILSPVPLTVTATAATSTGTASIEAPTEEVEETPTDTVTPTQTAIIGAVDATILGCDTGIDILHGMGEVTNAYVTIRNTTAADVPDLCATLRALDEGRPHPDKTKCLPSLPAHYQVTFKLTVDSTYQEATPIQVDVTSGQNLVIRVGEPACTAIGLLLPSVGNLDVPVPIP